jgi:hypothetical protein
MEDRRRRILSLVDPSREVGLEIGPLANPIVERSMGRILYSDHRSTEELRQQYAPHADKGALALADIVEIDLVVPENTSLPAVLGERGPVDYVVASHVMEHIRTRSVGSTRSRIAWMRAGASASRSPTSASPSTTTAT